ncbi:uncharacterized protein LOC144101788 [Amblyomma americanum]
MNAIRLCLAWLACAMTGAQLLPSGDGVDDTCNTTLPWAVSRDEYDDIPDSVFERLMQCPVGLHGCSDELVSCSPATYAATCSCAPNCKTYRDCCWDVALSEPSPDDFPGISCVEVQIGSSWKKFIYMVVGCPVTWPDDYVREGCERPDSFNDTFYLIPVTSVNHVTYRNGFCALCNEDIVSAAFWNSTEYQAIDRVRVVLPDIVEGQPALHLRPCSELPPYDNCSTDVPEDVSRRCKMYYAPVEDTSDPYGLQYRNAYCALCNGANVSRLSCSPVLHLSNVSVTSRKTGGPPNLAALFKPVVSTPNCYAEHDGHCYIRYARSLYTVMGRSGIGAVFNETPSSKTPPKIPEHEPTIHYNVKHYITVVCMSLSILCLTMKMVVFCAYREARSFSSKCTLCLSVTLLFTQLLFLITGCIGLPPVACATSAVLIHYGFLCTFLWTTVLSFDIWRSVTAVKLSSTREKTLAIYGLVAWGLPMVLVLTAVGVQVAAPWSSMSPSYGNPTCWISTFWGIIVYFLAPMAVLLLLCLFFYFCTVSYVRSTSSAAGCTREEKELSGDAGSRARQQRNHAALYVRLALIMGAPWAVAFLGTFLQFTAIDSIVNVLVGLEGAYLFFAFKDYRYLCSSAQTSLRPRPLTSSRATSNSDVSSSKKSRLSKWK